ncbi:13760_t:CDS:2, partial [Acaulospora morrowiae]
MITAASPQTPHMKTSKLSLDIGGFSGMGTPATPSSPSFSACPSPTLSVSMNMNKSQAELTALLKEAYNAIKEKERDLTLAAEIGKSLLENNISLKSKCEAMATQLQQLQRDRIKNATFSLQAGAVNKPNVTQIAAPDSFMEFDESDNDSTYGRSSSVDVPPINDSSKRGGSRVNYNDLENIKELEIKNMQLQAQLDDAIRECSENEKTTKAKIRKMESEISYYQEEYSSASQKIEDLEKENERLKQKQKSEFWNLKYNKNDNDAYLDTLHRKIADLEEQNETVERAKAEIERRLNRASKDLESLRESYNELADASKGYELLQVANREQELIINDLSETVEEQRAMIVSMRSGMYSRTQSRSSSFSESNIMTNAIRRLSNPDGASLFGSANTGSQQSNGNKFRKTLLSELENEWFRELTIFQRDGKKFGGNVESPMFSPVTSEGDLKNYFLSNGSHLDDDISQIDYLSDGEFSFLEEFEDDDIPPRREWFWKRWIRWWIATIYMFLSTIWKWCRFIVILIAALMMALYRGPDYIL